MWHYRRFSSENKFLVKLTRILNSYELEIIDTKFRRWKEHPTNSQLVVKCQELKGIELDPPKLITALEQEVLKGEDRNVTIYSISDAILELHISKIVLKIDYKLKLESVDVVREWFAENFLPLFALLASKNEIISSSHSSTSSQEVTHSKIRAPKEIKTFEIFSDSSTRQKYEQLASGLRDQKNADKSKERIVPSYPSATISPPPPPPLPPDIPLPLVVEKKSREEEKVRKREEEEERRETFKRKQNPDPVTKKKKKKFL